MRRTGQDESKQTDKKHERNWVRSEAGSSTHFFLKREEEKTEALLRRTEIFDVDLIFVPAIQFLETIHECLSLFLAAVFSGNTKRAS